MQRSKSKPKPLIPRPKSDDPSEVITMRLPGSIVQFLDLLATQNQTSRSRIILKSICSVYGIQVPPDAHVLQSIFYKEYIAKKAEQKTEQKQKRKDGLAKMAELADTYKLPD